MLQKGPQKKEAFALDLTFTSSARHAWREILRRLTDLEQRPLKLLLPAYIGQTDREGSGVFDPVREVECDFSFYPLSDRLIPNVDAIEQAIVTGDIDVLLVIHYFGFVHVDLNHLKTLCLNHNVKLVEDCAHCCYMPQSEYGCTGDYSFYSLHKFFPTETGGILRSNVAAGKEFSLDADARCEIGVLEQLLRTDIDAVIQKRRLNYRFLEKAMGNVRGVSAFWQLDEQTIPHNFPICVADNRREKLYFYLLDRELLTTALYYRLIDELDPKRYSTSFEVANSILNLPVHQDTNESDLKILVREIGKFIES
jgi:dTDP-4-amino-4,6-dideoxygalactose transaminase